MENNFDPNKATLGVHNRVGFITRHKTSRSGSESVSVPREDMGGGLGLGKNADRDFELARSAAMQIGSSSEYMDTYESFSKEANDEVGEYAPNNIEAPQFPEVGAENIDNAGRRGPNNVDLETHGAHEHPKPDPKRLIKERIQNMRKTMLHKAKKEVKEESERQEQKHEAFQDHPTKISINRREGDIDRDGAISKIGSSIISLLEEEDANAIKIMLVLDQVWEGDWREWEPETIIRTLEEDGVDVAKINLDKIMALKVLMNTMEFWNTPRTFEKVCLAFAGRMVDWGHIQEPRVHEIAACVAMVERYVAENEWSDDVAAYVAGSAIRDGYVLLPPILSFAEYPFSNELAFSMGDSALDVQTSLLKSLHDDGEIPKDHVVQYMRLLRCQYHIQEMVDQARA